MWSTLSTARTAGGTLRAIMVLTRVRLTMTRNDWWRSKVGLGVAVAVLPVAYFLYGFASTGVQAMTSPAFVAALRRAAQTTHGAHVPTDAMPYLLALPGIVLFVATVLLIAVSLSRVLSALYLSGDMDLLLVAPIPMRAVFVVKFVGALILPYVLLFALLGPALVGYGQGLHYGPAFFLTALGVLALLPLLPAGMGALLVLAVVRVLPARRAREIITVLGALVGAGVYLLSMLSQGQAAPQLDSVQTLDALRRLAVPLLPSAWAGRALMAAGRGEWLTLLVYGGLFAACSLGVFAGCLWLAERLYYAGWSNMATQGGPLRRKTHTRTRVAASERETAPRVRSAWGWAAGLSTVLPAQSRAILYKDLRAFPRDLGAMQQLILPLAMAVFWIFEAVAGSASSGGRAPGSSRFLPGLGPTAIGIAIGWLIAGQVGGSAISREGKSFWLLQVAPLSPWRLLLGKLMFAYAAYPLVGGIVAGLLAIFYRQTLLPCLGALALVALLGLGLSSIATGLGAAFPRLDWENPKQQTSGRAALLGLILGALYLGVAFGAVRGLPALGRLAPHLSAALTVAGWVILIAVTAVTMWRALSFGVARLDRVLLGEGSPS